MGACVRERERKMEAKIGENGGRRVLEGSAGAEKESEEVLKKMIASHRLYGVLIESHFDCLKVISSFFHPS